MSKSTAKNYLKLVLVISFVYLFLVSIGLMGAAFKGFGKGFAENLLQTTSNPFVGLFIGILATSLVQSSSTTTSIVVGMVASGVITIGNAVPIIMGANIGTTVTNTLVSLGHITRKEEFRRAVAGATVHDFFNLICVAIMFPIELATGFLQKLATGLAGLFENVGGIKFTSPIKMATKPAVNFIKNLFVEIFHSEPNIGYIFILIISGIVMYLALYFIVKLMKSLVIKRTEAVFDQVLGRNGLIGIFAGLFFTIIVQSSSITTSLLIPLIGAGIITVETVFPITMGANIGTTATAILASFATGNISAIIVAFVHFLFNVIGVLFIYPIKIFREIPIRLAKGLGNLAFKKRRYAIIYVISVFFVIPLVLITISKLFK
ncbi:MAG: Na/Pi symporter [Candidatus Omnitrophica bacterium]|nr:Na/Pi symporter [Candidatus Omnitrophota bacterium]